MTAETLADQPMSDTGEDRVLFEFPVLHEGWECDPKGWVMERPDGSRYLRLTTHGAPYHADAGELEERIKEYMDAIAMTRQAQALLAAPQG